MRQRQKLLVTVLCLAALVALATLLFRDREPCYQGHSLSYWTGFYVDTSSAEELYGSDPRADEAIRQIGTNALPYLLEWFESKPTPRFAWLRPLYWQLPAPARHAPLVGSLVFKNARPDLPERGFLGLLAMGPQARPAIPGLVRLMNSSSPIRSGRAVEVLVAIGQPALPELAATMTNQANPNRKGIIEGLQYLGAGGAMVTPVLTALLQDPDPAIRTAAQQSLDTLLEVLSNGPSQ